MELETSFHPLEAEQEFLQREIRFIRWPLGTGGPECLPAAPSIDAVAQGTASAAAFDMWVRDPASFIAGQPHRHLDVWDRLSHRYPQKELIREWISNGI